ncbi:hypothetical protein FQN60_014757 [Etheostoma spectabile]|uniref:Uncharacterized protein n=1 Tax=Etheostoma spectabile TaxID=54343 RepID=A0A5J5CRM5_9PERO|nr:hypothetical protein FQN60_014757 [Etheostoma spectabile]
MEVRTFDVRGPPSSPPISGRRRYISVPTAIKAKMVKSVTEKASVPGSTLNSSPLLLYSERREYARNGFLEVAAKLAVEKKMMGRLEEDWRGYEPRKESIKDKSLTFQASTLERLETIQAVVVPIMAVSSPIMQMETTKQAQPFQYSVGGTKAKITFQKTVRKCIT